MHPDDSGADRDGADAAAADSGLETLEPAGEREALEWLLVLAAIDIPHRLLHDPASDAWRIAVPGEQAGEARRQIDAYTRENAGWPPPPRPLPAPVQRTGWSSVWVAGLLVALYLWCGPYDPGVPILARAACDVERVRAGEWWRLLTALGVHADVTHLGSNVVATVALGAAAATELGGGVAWLLTLVAGVLANLTSAALHEGPLVCFGASTGVFGLLGLLAGRHVGDDVRTRARLAPGTQRGRVFTAARLWRTAGAAICVLVLLGTSPGSDLAGHFCGFAYGALLGTATAWWPGPRRIPELAQRLLEMAVLAAFMAAWRQAGLAGPGAAP